MYSRVSLQRSCWHVLGSVIESTAAATQSSCPFGTDRFFLRHSRHFVLGYSHASLRDNKSPGDNKTSYRLWEPRPTRSDYTKIGSISRRALCSRIVLSSGAAVKRLAASSTFGTSSISPGVAKKIPVRARTQCTAASMSRWSSNGSYQVERVRWRPHQGRRAIDLIVSTATFRSLQRATTRSNSAA